MNFGPDETIFEHCFAREYPARNLPLHREILARIAQDRKEDMLNEVGQSEQDPAQKVFILWAGETPAGYRLSAWKEPFLLPEWKKHLDSQCLNIIHSRCS